MEVVREGGRTMQMAAEIVELIPDSIVANRLEAADAQYLSRFEVHDVGSACRVTQSMTAQIRIPRLVPRRLVIWMLAARLRQDLGRPTPCPACGHQWSRQGAVDGCDECDFDIVHGDPAAPATPCRLRPKRVVS